MIQVSVTWHAELDEDDLILLFSIKQHERYYNAQGESY